MWTDDNLKERHYKSSPHALPTAGKHLLKANAFSWSEVAAYQVAERLSLPIPEVAFFVAASPLAINGTAVPAGHMCLLLEQLKLNCYCPCIVTAPCSDTLKSQIVAFFVFNGGCEWPEIWECDRGVVILDLERQFPVFDEHAATREHALHQYSLMSKSSIGECIDLAIEGGFLDDFTVAAEGMTQTLRTFLPDFSGCENRDELKAFYSRAISLRLKTVDDFIRECA